MTVRFQPQSSVRTETLGVNLGSTRLTTVTCGAAVKGNWATIGTTSFDYHYILVTAAYHNAASDILVDIGIDYGADSVGTIIPDFKNARRAILVWPGHGAFPLHVPAGSTLVARAEGAAGTNTIDVSIAGFSTGIGGAPGLARCHSLYTAQNRRGTALTLGGSNSKPGSWTQLISSVPGDIESLVVMIDDNNDTSRSNAFWLMDLGIGASGNEQTILADLAGIDSANSHTALPANISPIPCQIPSGSRLAMRGQSSLATADARAVAVWGLGP